MEPKRLQILGAAEIIYDLSGFTQEPKFQKKKKHFVKCIEDFSLHPVGEEGL